MELNYEFMINTLSSLLKGVPVTLGLTFFSLVLAFPIAFFMALGRLNKVRYLEDIIRFYISLIRGIPMVVQILIVYSILPSFLNYIFKSAGIRYNVFDLNTIWYALIIFTISTAALLSEVFRSALASIDNGQLEAGQAMGISLYKIYLRIIIPQALVVAFPSLCNLTVSLIKNTSLAFMMAVKDITAVGKIAASYGYNYVEAYLDIFIFYIVICSIVQIAFSKGEKYLGRFRRPLANA